jgi:ketosteroid isomerase-like protein
MNATENAEVVSAGYEAFANGDMETVAKLFAPTLSWHVPGRSPIAGDYTGPDEVFGYFGRLMDGTGGTFHIEIHDLLASNDHVVVLTRETAVRDGRSLDANLVHIWHLQDRQATEFWAIPADAQALDAFWS